MMVNSTTSPTLSNASGFTNFLKMKWRTSKDPKSGIRQRLPNTVDDIERDWVRHCALKLAFESDFKAPIQRLLQAGGVEVLDIGCGAGFWSNDMAARFPISYFTGVDIDKNVLPTSTMSKNVLYRHMDIIDLPLPFEDSTFDYIYIRSMINTLPDALWDDVLKELVRVMKKGAYIECVEAYDNLFDTGPSMDRINQLIQLSLLHPNQYPLPSTFDTTDPLNNTISSPASFLSSVNPWPNRLANINQLVGMQIYHTHTPVGLYGGEIGSLLLEYWERSVKSQRREWVQKKLITDIELDKILDLMRDEVDELNTHMSWYSVVAQKKGYSGPVIQFDDVDEYDIVHTTIC